MLSPEEAGRLRLLYSETDRSWFAYVRLTLALWRNVPALLDLVEENRHLRQSLWIIEAQQKLARHRERGVERG